ncbi:hypothetical protein MMU48_23480, partial [Escherichia coli]
QNDVTLKMPAFEWVHVQLHQQKGMISLSPPTICNSAPESTGGVSEEDPEPPPSQPANRVALKIAAKSDFLYLNFLFINNASDKKMLKNW